MSIWTALHVKHVLDWPLFALKVSPTHVRICTPCNAWFLEPTRVQITNGITISSAAFVGFTVVTAGDHASASAAVGSIWLVLQCGLIKTEWKLHVYLPVPFLCIVAQFLIAIASIDLTLLVDIRKSIWSVKNWVMGCWHSYLPGTRSDDLRMVQLMPLPPHHLLL